MGRRRVTSARAPLAAALQSPGWPVLVQPRLLLALLLGCAIALPAQATAWRELAGSYAVTGPDMLTPAPDAPTDSHLRLQFRGLTARDLYRAIPGEPGTDECTGGRLKASDDLRCVHFEDSDRYQCDVAIDLRTGEMEVGIPC